MSTPCDCVKGLWDELLSKVRGMVCVILLNGLRYTVKVPLLYGERSVGHR